MSLLADWQIREQIKIAPFAEGEHTVRKDITGKVFGKLTVICRTNRKNSQGTRIYWLCRCECGKETEVHRGKLSQGHTTSCGCVQSEWRKRGFRKLWIKHGMSGKSRSREFNCWTGMRSRCSDKKNAKYPNYGGRGIKVCERWANSFSNFYEDVGPSPSARHSIDRIDVNGDYCPENCRWATPAQQADNKTNTIRLTCDGVTRTATEWARIFGVSRMTIIARIKKYGWDTDKAIKTPVTKGRK
jgi:hypothetical protein